MVMSAAVAFMVLSEQLIDQTAYSLEQMRAGRPAAGTRTEGQPREDQRHDR
jgi:hypothetical protein